MASRKRPITEVVSFDKISDAAPSAKVYRTVTSVSQMKRGKKQNYFEGSLSDGTTKIRLVGFIPKVQRQLNEILEIVTPSRLTTARSNNHYKVMQSK